MRRRAQSDERRRRMLVDESPCETPGNGVSRWAASENASYASDTLLRQPQCIAFLPRRLWVHPLLWLSASLVLVGLVLLHHWQVDRLDGPWDIFQVQHPASLATWLSVVGLIGIALLTLNIFSLRRYRKSDYHSRYRWWIWVSATAMFSSLAVATTGHQVAARAVAATTEWSLPFGDHLFWLVPAGCIYTFLAIRLVLEFRHCRLATLGIVVAWLVFCLRSVMLLDFEFGVPESWQASIAGGSTLGIVALVGCGFLWYARHVLLDIEGRLPVRTEKNGNKKRAAASLAAKTKKESEASVKPKGRSDLEPDVSHRAAELVDESVYDTGESEEDISTGRKPKDSRKRRSINRNDAEHEEIPEHRSREQQRKISKAERKKLRKLKAKERHAA